MFSVQPIFKWQKMKCFLIGLFCEIEHKQPFLNVFYLRIFLFPIGHEGVLQIRLILSDHIPYKNCNLSGGGSNGGISTFSVCDPLEKGCKGMFFLVSDAIRSLV